MNAISTTWLFILLISCSCIQKKSQNKLQTQKEQNYLLDWNSDLRIDNGPIQGLSFTNSLGVEYGHAYRTTIFTNEGTAPIPLQFTLSNEYSYPAPHNDQKFQIVIWPAELTPNKVTFTDNISAELRNFLESDIDTPFVLQKSIESLEKYVITIGTLYKKPTDYFVSPKVLFIQSDDGIFNECENFINQMNIPNSSFSLGLILNFSGLDCINVPIGLIHHPKE